MTKNIPFSQYFPHFPRQTAQQLTVDEAIAQCKNVANDVISCFPPAGYTVSQDQDLEFVWNSRLSSFIQKNQVDLRIFRQDDKQQQVLAQYGLINNPDGQVPYRSRANDSWWGDSGANWKGQNISHSFYWTISPAGQQSELTQPVFTVVQTTGPSSSSQVASTSTPAATGLPSSDTKHSKISKGAIGGIVAGVVVFFGSHCGCNCSMAAQNKEGCTSERSGRPLNIRLAISGLLCKCKWQNSCCIRRFPTTILL
ncbi:hypothetical protein DL96DRAFT_1614552, partial [Flagelloscypha sp. PMI_526]